MFDLLHFKFYSILIALLLFTGDIMYCMPSCLVRSNFSPDFSSTDYDAFLLPLFQSVVRGTYSFFK